MNCKSSGHYFCEKCDDLAFGRFCQRCHGPARWIANEPVKPELKRVSETHAREWFIRMREAVNERAGGV
jgi:hypothetical protein